MQMSRRASEGTETWGNPRRGLPRERNAEIGHPRRRERTGVRICIMKLSDPAILLLGVSVAFTGCMHSPTGNDLDFPSAIVYGTVVTATGSSVEGARVLIEHRPDGCDEPRFERAEVFSDISGRFRKMFSLFSTISASSCLVAYALPPPASDSRPSSVVSFEVEFNFGVPRDSVRVDLVLNSP